MLYISFIRSLLLLSLSSLLLLSCVDSLGVEPKEERKSEDTVLCRISFSLFTGKAPSPSLRDVINTPVSESSDLAASELEKTLCNLRLIIVEASTKFIVWNRLYINRSYKDYYPDPTAFPEIKYWTNKDDYLFSFQESEGVKKATIELPLLREKYDFYLIGNEPITSDGNFYLNLYKMKEGDRIPYYEKSGLLESVFLKDAFDLSAGTELALTPELFRKRLLGRSLDGSLIQEGGKYTRENYPIALPMYAHSLKGVGVNDQGLLDDTKTDYGFSLERVLSRVDLNVRNYRSDGAGSVKLLGGASDFKVKYIKPIRLGNNFTLATTIAPISQENMCKDLSSNPLPTQSALSTVFLPYNGAVGNAQGVAQTGYAKCYISSYTGSRQNPADNFDGLQWPNHFSDHATPINVTYNKDYFQYKISFYVAERENVANPDIAFDEANWSKPDAVLKNNGPSAIAIGLEDIIAGTTKNYIIYIKDPGGSYKIPRNCIYEINPFISPSSGQISLTTSISSFTNQPATKLDFK